MDPRQQLTNPDNRLPMLELLSIQRGSKIPLRGRRGKATVIILAHHLDCAACGAFVQEMDRQRWAIDEWDGELRVVTTAVGPATPAGLLSVPVLLDEENRLSDDFGLTAPAMLIADQWGEIHAIEPAGEDHRFMPLDEILSWLRYLSIKCPECEGESY